MLFQERRIMLLRTGAFKIASLLCNSSIVAPGESLSINLEPAGGDKRHQFLQIPLADMCGVERNGRRIIPCAGTIGSRSCRSLRRIGLGSSRCSRTSAMMKSVGMSSQNIEKHSCMESYKARLQPRSCNLGLKASGKTAGKSMP